MVGLGAIATKDGMARNDLKCLEDRAPAGPTIWMEPKRLRNAVHDDDDDDDDDNDDHDDDHDDDKDGYDNNDDDDDDNDDDVRQVMSAK